MKRAPMTIDDLAALARAAGLDLSEETLAEILPQMERTAEGIDKLAGAELAHVEPAVTFRPGESN
jgi:Asp-tRNA(Asn)/Glu-tRNA(Gln) amidotransferase C subunit